MGLFNSTCPLSKAYIDKPNAEKPIIGNVKFQDLMFYICSGFTIWTVIISMALMIKHLMFYYRPREQRQIVRIAFLPPLYSILSLFSIYSYPDSIYLIPARTLYEPVALASLFFLYTEFVAPEPDTREMYFSQLENRKKRGGRFSRNKAYDVFPGGSLVWFQSKWVAVYFYFVATVVIKIVEEITQAAGRFCQSSFSPAYAHVWVIVISDLALPIGVVAVIQFYLRLKSESEFRIHKPTAKLLSFKAVILIDFFQELIFDILTGTHAFKGTSTVTFKDFSIGIPNMLICFEQAIVAVVYHWSFSTKEYRALSKVSSDRPNIFKAAVNAMNPSDLFMGFVYAVKLLLSGVGPRGNGSWRKDGGYGKIIAEGDVQMQTATMQYGNGPAYDSTYGYDYTRDGDAEHTAQHVLLPTQTPSGQS